LLELAALVEIGDVGQICEVFFNCNKPPHHYQGAFPLVCAAFLRSCVLRGLVGGRPGGTNFTELLVQGPRPAEAQVRGQYQYHSKARFLPVSNYPEAVSQLSLAGPIKVPRIDELRPILDFDQCFCRADA
jgi:hypothetical protein